jgi:peptidoglycan/xylan/chitin deacetylase (PgdA/CDA1 family)
MTGIFILSLDTEIAWGTYGEHDLNRQCHNFDNNRQIVQRLVDLLDKYDIAATWAVVGHLFLDHCNGHPDVLQPHYAWADKPDAERDPCTNIEKDSWYYGSDIIQMIRNAKTQHEIGTHTFTHVMAGDPAVSLEIWQSQLRKTVAIHRENGLTATSLVFPQNKIKYVEQLSQFGITAYRGEEQSWYASLPKRIQRACHLLDRAIGLRPPTYDPNHLRQGKQLVNLPASQFYMSYDGIRRYIPLESRVRQARLGLNRAERNGHLYHLWFHPFNLGSSEQMFDGLEMILNDVATRRDAGRIKVMTMAQAAQWVLDGASQHA